MRRLTAWLASFRTVDPIDDLIAAKGVQAYRPGMERPDHRVMDQIGRERWMQTLHAQRHGLRQVQKRTA